MTSENKKKNAFFNSYVAFMDYLKIISNKPNEYKILVSKEYKGKDYCNLNISIENTYNTKDNNKIYANNITLNNDSINELINEIRNNFIDTHYVTYASINEKELNQTIQNTRFSLIFKLTTYFDLAEAYEINSSINLGKEKTNKGKIRELGLK